MGIAAGACAASTRPNSRHEESRIKNGGPSWASMRTPCSSYALVSNAWTPPLKVQFVMVTFSVGSSTRPAARAPFLRVGPVDAVDQLGNSDGRQRGFAFADGPGDLLEELSRVEVLPLRGKVPSSAAIYT